MHAFFLHMRTDLRLFWSWMFWGWFFFSPPITIKVHLYHNYKQRVCATIPFIHRNSWKERVCSLDLPPRKRTFYSDHPFSLHVHGLLYGHDNKTFSRSLWDES